MTGVAAGLEQWLDGKHPILLFLLYPSDTLYLLDQTANHSTHHTMRSCSELLLHETPDTVCTAACCQPLDTDVMKHSLPCYLKARGVHNGGPARHSQSCNIIFAPDHPWMVSRTCICFEFMSSKAMLIAG